jgi:ubiquinone/menaquinone biosynthesis C-methylase UbiE
MIRGEASIREAYRSDEVARTYIDRRFREPLFAMLHDRQVAVVTNLIKRERLNRILDLAPGPARVTRDVARACTGQGIMLDASLQMLGEARRRLKGCTSRWRAVQGDAFQLPLAGPLDLIYSFRLIRHFDEHDRERMFREVRRVLRPGGWLVFDAVNERVARQLRLKSPQDYRHYDMLSTPATIEHELTRAGFEAVELIGIQRHFPALEQLQVLVGPRSRRAARALMECVERLGGEPLEWVVISRRA